MVIKIILLLLTKPKFSLRFLIFSNYFSSNKDIHYHHTPVPYYIYPALALLLVLNVLNLKPVSYGIPYQKDLEKSRTLILLKLNCPFT